MNSVYNLTSIIFNTNRIVFDYVNDKLHSYCDDITMVIKSDIGINSKETYHTVTLDLSYLLTINPSKNNFNFNNKTNVNDYKHLSFEIPLNNYTGSLKKKDYYLYIDNLNNKLDIISLIMIDNCMKEISNNNTEYSWVNTISQIESVKDYITEYKLIKLGL